MENKISPFLRDTFVCRGKVAHCMPTCASDRYDAPSTRWLILTTTVAFVKLNEKIRPSSDGGGFKS